MLWPGSELLAYILLTPYAVLSERVPELAQKLPWLFASEQRRIDRACEGDNRNWGRYAACALAAEKDGAAATEQVCKLCSNRLATLGAANDSSADSAEMSPSLPPYALACHLLHGRRVLELGAGFGLLGLIIARFARSVTLTDHKEEVLQLLERNVLLAREQREKEQAAQAPAIAAAAPTDAEPSPRPEMLRRIVADIRVANLAWGPTAQLPTFAPTVDAAAVDDCDVTSSSSSAPSVAPFSGEYDILVGGDIVYDGTIVPILFEVVARYLSTRSPRAVFMCSYLTRWRVVDTEMEAAMERHALHCIRVPLESFMPTPLPPRFKHGNMLLIWKA